MLAGFHSASMAEFVTTPTDLVALLRNPGSPCCTERVTGERQLFQHGYRYAHDFTLCDWFWGVKHNPGIGYNCPCQEQFTKSMWWSILYSSAELLPDCPYLYLFSDEDWRRLNLFPKLKSRIRNGEQFRKLIALTRHSFRTHISDEVTQL